MKLKNKTAQLEIPERQLILSQLNDQVFSKDYVDFLNDAGWRLERKLPSNKTNYSDLLEDTDWKSIKSDLRCSIHYRRDLDALS